MKRLLISFLYAVSAITFAADYEFDTAHTQIFFSASHAGFTTSTGAFVDFDGSFNFDEKDVSQSKVEVTIQTDSIDLNDATWNDHMMGKKWFDVESYPTMVFKSTSVKKTSDKTMDVLGDFTLKGVTKPVTLKVTFNKAGALFGKEKIGFSAATTIDRTEFGMTANASAVGTMIPIRIEVEGVKVGE